jgi:hypothetical protein
MRYPIDPEERNRDKFDVDAGWFELQGKAKRWGRQRADRGHDLADVRGRIGLLAATEQRKAYQISAKL